MKVFSSDKGFTIVETMVAIAILAVGTLGVASMLMIHFSSDGYAAADEESGIDGHAEARRA